MIALERMVIKLFVILDTANKSAYIQNEYNRYLNEINMRPLNQQNTAPGSVNERVAFITDTKFTGFQHNQQLTADPETMKRLEEDEVKRKLD
jgi:hypothetical protein